MREILIIICFWISFSETGQCFDLDVKYEIKNVRELAAYSELNGILEDCFTSEALITDEKKSNTHLIKLSSFIDLELKFIRGAIITADLLDVLNVGFCALDYVTNKLGFSAAFNSVFLIRNREIIKHKVNKYSLASSFKKNVKHPRYSKLIQKKATLFTCILRQFSESKRKKINHKQFRELLLRMKQKDMVSQKDILDKTTELEKFNDIIAIGVKINE